MTNFSSFKRDIEEKKLDEGVGFKWLFHKNQWFLAEADRDCSYCILNLRLVLFLTFNSQEANILLKWICNLRDLNLFIRLFQFILLMSEAYSEPSLTSMIKHFCWKPLFSQKNSIIDVWLGSNTTLLCHLLLILLLRLFYGF